MFCNVRNILLLSFCIIINLAGCNYRVERDPNIIVRYFSSDPQVLNPIISTDENSSIILDYIMESLLELDPKTSEYIGRLAKSWDVSEDHLQYTFHINKNVHWHDGVPFTAQDIVYSFERINDPKVGAAHMMSYFSKSGIRKAIAIDDYTIRFELANPYVFALRTIGFMPIVPKHIYDVKEYEFRKNPANRAPIGTGPMKFVEWQTGKYVKLIANHEYWRKLPDWKGMTFKLISDQGVAFQAMKKREIDVTGVRSIQWARQLNSPAIEKYFKKMKYFSESAGYAYIGWNLKRKILSDKNVRRALTMLVPQEKIIESLFFGEGEVITGPFHPRGPQYDHDLKPWPYDPKFASQLLDRAGWSTRDSDGYRVKDGKRFELTVIYPGPSRSYNAMSNIVRENFKRAGIALEVQRMEWTVFLKTISSKKYDCYFGGWTGLLENDPYQIWHSSQNKGSNYISYNNPKVDGLILQARVEFDETKRAKLYQRIHKYLYEDQPYTFLFAFPTLAVRHHRFTNVEIYSGGLDYTEWKVGKSEPLYQ